MKMYIVCLLRCRSNILTSNINTPVVTWANSGNLRWYALAIAFMLFLDTNCLTNSFRNVRSENSLPVSSLNLRHSVYLHVVFPALKWQETKTVFNQEAFQSKVNRPISNRFGGRSPRMASLNMSKGPYVDGGRAIKHVCTGPGYGGNTLVNRLTDRHTQLKTLLPATLLVGGKTDAEALKLEELTLHIF